MPKHNINYDNCIIYKIVCKDENCKDIYVGQTCDFIRRKHAHKAQSQKKNLFLYKIIDENGGWANWNMEVVQEFPATSKQDVLDREQYWINNLQANLNTHVRYDPSDYKREWYFKNRERIQQHQKENRERIQQQQKEKEEQMLIDKRQYVIDPQNLPDWYLANMKSQIS